MRNFLFLGVLLVSFLALPCKGFSADVYDSLYISTLNMTDAEIADVYGNVDSIKITPPTLEEQNEENPGYVKREYDHREQVIVGGVVMLCVALAMVLMNNYNPTR